MKLFEIVQENFALLGFSPNQPRFNSKSAMVFLFIGLAAILCALFLFFEASTFIEYVNTFYTTSVAIACNIIFATLLFKKEKLLQTIYDLQEFVDKSELPHRTGTKTFDNLFVFTISESENAASKATYNETIRFIEKWSKIGYFAVAVMSPVCVVLLPATIRYVVYFTTTAGNDAFVLPFLLW